MEINHLSSLLSCFDPRVRETLLDLYRDCLRVDPQVRRQVASQKKGAAIEGDSGFYADMREAYMPVTPDMGLLLYQLVRMTRARSIVEYGGSFGVSTIFLAAGLRDNGGGRLLSTELFAHKAERARHHLQRAGLDDLVEIRVGDARVSLASAVPPRIDLLLLDGAKSDYLPLLQLLAPRLPEGALVCADNSDMAGAGAFMDHLAVPAHGYVRSALFSNALGQYHGHLIALRSKGGATVENGPAQE